MRTMFTLAGVLAKAATLFAFFYLTALWVFYPAPIAAALKAFAGAL